MPGWAQEGVGFYRGFGTADARIDVLVDDPGDVAVLHGVQLAERPLGRAQGIGLEAQHAFAELYKQRQVSGSARLQMRFPEFPFGSSALLAGRPQDVS
jgi:hypothetical protein